MKFTKSMTKPITTGLAALVFASGCGKDSNPAAVQNSPTSYELAHDHIKIIDNDGIDTVYLITRNAHNLEGNVEPIPGYSLKQVDIPIRDENDSLTLISPYVSLKTKDICGNISDTTMHLK
jgi:hypothetical protein